MKTKFLIAICAAALFAVSCGGDEPIAPQEPEVPETPETPETPEEPEKVDNPVIEGPVRTEFDGGVMLLERYDTIYEKRLPVTKMEAEIVGGNGDYKIIYPEKVLCHYLDNGLTASMVPYSEDILKVWVEGNIIKVELVLPAYNPNGSGARLWVRGYFILEDSKGGQKKFRVETLTTWG